MERMGWGFGMRVGWRRALRFVWSLPPEVQGTGPAGQGGLGRGLGLLAGGKQASGNLVGELAEEFRHRETAAHRLTAEGTALLVGKRPEVDGGEIVGGEVALD